MFSVTIPESLVDSVARFSKLEGAVIVDSPVLVEFSCTDDVNNGMGLVKVPEPVEKKDMFKLRLWIS